MYYVNRDPTAGSTGAAVRVGGGARIRWGIIPLGQRRDIGPNAIKPIYPRPVCVFPLVMLLFTNSASHVRTINNNNTPTMQHNTPYNTQVEEAAGRVKDSAEARADQKKDKSTSKDKTGGKSTFFESKAANKGDKGGKGANMMSMSDDEEEWR